MVSTALLASRLPTLKSLQRSHLPIRTIYRTLTPQHRPTNSLKFNLTGVEKTIPSLSWDSWFTSFAGRQFMAKYVGFGGFCVVITGFYSFKIFMMEWMRDEYKEEGPQISLRARISGADDELPGRSPQLLKLMSDSQERAGVEDSDIEHLEVFFSCLMDPVVAGCTNTRQGGLVGLPRYMLEENFDMKKLRVKTNYNKMFRGFKIPENINQEDQQELERCLSLSEQEKQFIMSFCLAKASSWSALLTTAGPGLFWVFHYFLAYRVNNRWKLLETNRFIRLAIQGFFGVISLCFYIFYYNISNFEADTDALSLVCTTREEVEVALGYFDKVLERNKILRKVIGEGMEYNVQENGELVPFFYEMEIFASLAVRVKYLKHMLDQGPKPQLKKAGP